MKFSANTGFLWPELPFLDRIARAATAGFNAVEFHDEAQTADPAALRDALDEAGLPVAGLNMRMGETSGCAAFPGRESTARADIDTALRLAETLDAPAVHVLAGCTDAPGASATYAASLAHACDATARTILIEPLSPSARPGYHLSSLDQALEVIAALGRRNLRILFDCYHIAEIEGDVAAAFARAAPHVGHVQIAGWPGRGDPTEGSLDYGPLLKGFAAKGYRGPVGFEYRATRPVRETLAALRAAVA